MTTTGSDFDQIQGLLGDRGTLIGTGNMTVIVEPEPASDAPSTHVSHSVDHVTYMDGTGHVHAVLIDTVTTITPGPPVGVSTVMEILSDVQIT